MISPWYMGIYKMNKFNAMSKVLSAKVMKRNPNDREWSFVFKGTVFADISKSSGKYFVHYVGRTTALVGHKSFMKAVAVVAGVFLELYNSDKICSGEELYSDDNLTAFVGSDNELYIKTVHSKPVHVPAYMTTFEHLKKYCQHVGSTDKLQDLAEVINANYNQYIMDSI